MADTYKVRRSFFGSNRRPTVYKGLTLQEAQEHCKSPESSHKTATSAAAKARTRKYGPWFDGYDKE